MAQGGSIVRGGVVQRLAAIRMAKDGRVQTPYRILVACGGQAREVWPPTAAPPEDTIRLPSDDIVVQHAICDPCPALAYIEMLSDGTLQWVNDTGNVCPQAGPSNVISYTAIGPPPVAASRYLVRLTDTSTGDASPDGPMGWVSLSTSPRWSVSQSGLGAQFTDARLELARDDGNGNPVDLVGVNLTMLARVDNCTVDPDPPTQPPGLDPSTPWLLEDQTVGEPAFVQVLIEYFYGPGRLIGRENRRTKYEETYADPATQQETAGLFIVRGPRELIVGSPLDTYLPLSFVLGDFRQEWYLIQETAGESEVVAELRLNDGTGNITRKQITMRVKREDGVPTIPLEPGGALPLLYDRNPNNRPGVTPAVELRIDTDGNFYGDLQIQADPTNPIGQWLDGQDASAFEVRVTVEGGPFYFTGTVNQWVPLDADLTYRVFAPPPDDGRTTYEVTQNANLTITIRQRNKIENSETWTVTMIADNIVQFTEGPGGGLPLP